MTGEFIGLTNIDIDKEDADFLKICISVTIGTFYQENMLVEEVNLRARKLHKMLDKVTEESSKSIHDN